MRKRLTATNVYTIPAPATVQIDVFDELKPGLALRLSAKGARSWVVFYRVKAGAEAGKQRRWTIGRLAGRDHKSDGDDLPTLGRRARLTLAQARRAADDVFARADAGADPAAESRMLHPDTAKAPETYKEAVEDYITRYQVGEKGNVTADEVKRLLLKEGTAWLERPINEISAREIRSRLEEIRDGTEIERAKPYLANRTYAALKTFFAWCSEPGIDLVERSPMERLRRPWAGEKPRDRVLSHDEIKALWEGADKLISKDAKGKECSDVYGLAFVKLGLLLGKRKGALAAMKHADIDDAGIWSPPPGNKNKRTHPIPLPPLALRIIKSLPVVERNPHVFVGRFERGHLDPGTQLQAKIREKSGIPDFYFHATRHTVETGMAEIGLAPHVRDLVMDHAPARGAGAGYDHHHYRDEMLDALERWEGHVKDIVWPDGVERVRG